MHEMSLCESVLKIIEDSAVQQGFHQVKTVWLEIGTLAGVDPQAMLFSFDVVTKGSIAEQATLEIIEKPAEAWCMQCAQAVKITQRYDACPNCESYQLQVSGGDELRIKELEVE